MNWDVVLAVGSIRLSFNENDKALVSHVDISFSVGPLHFLDVRTISHTSIIQIWLNFSELISVDTSDGHVQFR